MEKGKGKGKKKGQWGGAERQEVVEEKEVQVAVTSDGVNPRDLLAAILMHRCTGNIMQINMAKPLGMIPRSVPDPLCIKRWTWTCPPQQQPRAPWHHRPLRSK